ncbi:MAG: hypothetical protein HY392_04740 [Candidatus Diapherotrites archaeon]|nr:hypothetical protein [Candidatus Diapherotrites archaeon]
MRNENIAESIKRKAEQTKEELGERMEGIQDTIDAKLERLRIMREQVRTEIKHRPLTYVAIAFGAGLMLGLLTRRRA